MAAMKTMTIRANADVELTFPQQRDADRFDAFGDGCTGTIDYDTPINSRAIEAWPDGEARGGWGIGPWGSGPWGVAARGVGWGRGMWGFGAWGFGRQAIHHTLGDVDDGAYKLAVVGYDKADNRITPATTTATIVVAADPEPPTELLATAYAGGQVTLSFTRSPDDG